MEQNNWSTSCIWDQFLLVSCSHAMCTILGHNRRRSIPFDFLACLTPSLGCHLWHPSLPIGACFGVALHVATTPSVVSSLYSSPATISSRPVQATATAWPMARHASMQKVVAYPIFVPNIQEVCWIVGIVGIVGFIGQ